LQAEKQLQALERQKAKLGMDRILTPPPASQGTSFSVRPDSLTLKISVVLAEAEEVDAMDIDEQPKASATSTYEEEKKKAASLPHYSPEELALMDVHTLKAVRP